LNILIGALKYLEVNKEFFVIISILCVLVLSLIFIAKSYFVVVKAYASFLVKQEQCDGRFNLQDFKIATNTKDVEESKKTSKEALDAVQEIKTCTGKMQKTVEKIETGFNDLIEGKYEKEKTL
jgi:hypothetical protein